MDARLKAGHDGGGWQRKQGLQKANARGRGPRASLFLPSW